ncbi:MAG TPA: hypothetical protein VI916_10365, partial [Acidimicrobiia bacterium]|nr:hypothetical protein [Acidimicrobiia bacterium]
AGTSAAPGAVEGAGAEPGAPPTTTPVESGHGPGPDECGTWEVWFGAGAAGGGHECSFHASSPGGYEAWGDWTITIHRRGETITFSPERGFEPNAKRCSPTGTIQPGDFVEVYVGSTGSASAGKSFGKDCSA